MTHVPSERETHEDSGWRCLVAHYAPDGNRFLPACIRCTCGAFVRPEDWDTHARPAARGVEVAE